MLQLCEAGIRISFTGFYSRHRQGRIELPPQSMRSDIQHNPELISMCNAQKMVYLNSVQSCLPIMYLENLVKAVDSGRDLNIRGVFFTVNALKVPCTNK